MTTAIRKARARRSYDGVVASYVRELSATAATATLTAEPGSIELSRRGARRSRKQGRRRAPHAEAR
jgi:hypothetical protein